MLILLRFHPAHPQIATGTDETGVVFVDVPDMITSMPRPTWNPLASLAQPTGPPTLLVASVSADGTVERTEPEPFAGLAPGQPVPTALRELLRACAPSSGACFLPSSGESEGLAAVARPGGGYTVFGARSAPSRFAHLVGLAPVGVLRVAPNGTVRYSNPAAAALLGASPDALVGTLLWSSGTHPEDRWRLTEALRAANGRAPSTVAFRRDATNGGSRVLQAHVLPDLDGDLLSVVLLDLTAQSEMEAALQQSETLYATFLEQSPVGLVHLDTTGTVTFENLRFRAIVGENAEDAWIGRSILAIPGTDAPFAALVRRVLRGEAVQGQAVCYHPPSGDLRRLLVNGAPILHEDGALIGAVLMIHDETQERAHADEATLRQRFTHAEGLLRQGVVDGVDEADFLATAAQTLNEALGVHRTGVFLPLTLHPDTFTVRTSWGEGTDAFEDEAFVPSGVPELAEAVAHHHVVVLTDESPAPEAGGLAERTFVPFYDGDTLGGIIVADRMAPLAAPMDELRASLATAFADTVGTLLGSLRLANRFRVTVSAIDDALFSYSLTESNQRRFLFLTDQIERLTGYPAAHFLRHDGTWEALCATDADRDALRAHLQRLLHGEDSDVTLGIRTTSNEVRYIRERAAPSKDETNTIQIAGIFTDVTEQRAAEDALRATAEASEQASRDKSAFIYTLSHELRTPLGALHGFADLLAMELGPDASPDVKEFAETIRDKAKQTLTLVNDLFDLTHLDLGHVALSATPVPLGPLVDAAVEKARPLGRPEVATDVQVTGHPVAVADPQRLASVLDNLLSNAYKFTHEGVVRVRAWQAGNRVALRVEDTGVGMSEAFLPRLFTPFVQEDQRLNRDYNGTGLGLALAKRLVERMHGTVEVESLKDAGSTFTVWLPAA